MMTEQEKKQLVMKALDVAEFMHKDKPEVAEVLTRLSKAKESYQKEVAVLRQMQMDITVEQKRRNQVLMPYIPEALRG
jgi:hypothetical protein